MGDKNAPEQKDFARLVHAYHDNRQAADVSRYRINLKDKDRPHVDTRPMEEDPVSNELTAADEVLRLRKRVKDLEAKLISTAGGGSTSAVSSTAVDPRHQRIMYTPLFVVSVVARLPNFSSVRVVTEKWIADGAVDEAERRQAW